MFDAWNGYGVYFFFASLMLISAVFVYFCVPETKGVPLELNDRLFTLRPVWRAHQILFRELDAENEVAAGKKLKEVGHESDGEADKPESKEVEGRSQV